MKTRFILFRRGGVYYSEDTTTRKQSSLRTNDETEALTLLNTKNESFRQSVLNIHLAGRTHRQRSNNVNPDVAIGPSAEAKHPLSVSKMVAST